VFTGAQMELIGLGSIGTRYKTLNYKGNFNFRIKIRVNDRHILHFIQRSKILMFKTTKELNCSKKFHSKSALNTTFV
jgi:hypothetical protein